MAKVRWQKRYRPTSASSDAAVDSTELYLRDIKHRLVLRCSDDYCALVAGSDASLPILGRWCTRLVVATLVTLGIPRRAISFVAIEQELWNDASIHERDGGDQLEARGRDGTQARLVRCEGHAVTCQEPTFSTLVAACAAIAHAWCWRLHAKHNLVTLAWAQQQVGKLLLVDPRGFAHPEWRQHVAGIVIVSVAQPWTTQVRPYTIAGRDALIAPLNLSAGAWAGMTAPLRWQ